MKRWVVGFVVSLLLTACGGASSVPTTGLAAVDAPTSQTTTSSSTTTTIPVPTTATTIATTTTVPTVAMVEIINIVWDTVDNDVIYNESEYVTLMNSGAAPVDVTGWWLKDEADHRIVIPSGYVIPTGGTLDIHTGPGDSTDTKYFFGAKQAIWNNSGGDTATLFDDANQLIDTFSY